MSSYISANRSALSRILSFSYCNCSISRNCCSFKSCKTFTRFCISCRTLSCFVKCCSLKTCVACSNNSNASWDFGSTLLSSFKIGCETSDFKIVRMWFSNESLKIFFIGDSRRVFCLLLVGSCQPRMREGSVIKWRVTTWPELRSRMSPEGDWERVKPKTVLSLFVLRAFVQTKYSARELDERMGNVSQVESSGALTNSSNWWTKSMVIACNPALW